MVYHYSVVVDLLLPISLHQNLVWIIFLKFLLIDGYEQQEAELVGEGNLTSVYKTMQGVNSSSPMAFKVFKVSFNLIFADYTTPKMLKYN